MAREYAALGLPVIPLYTPDPDAPGGCDCRRRDCASPGKHPRTMHGVKDATTDPEAIDRWWRMWPQANVGIATGHGVVVLDVDPRNGGDESLAKLEAEHGPILAPTVRTGGGGLHFYLVGTLPARSGFLSGLDLKAAGGLVAAPPSLHASGAQYEWIVRHEGVVQGLEVPAWLRELVDPPRPDWAAKYRKADAPVSRRYIQTAIEAECMAVARALEGSRNDTLNKAAFALARFVLAGQADGAAVTNALTIAAREAGLGDREIRRTIKSAFHGREVAA